MGKKKLNCSLKRVAIARGAGVGSGLEKERWVGSVGGVVSGERLE